MEFDAFQVRNVSGLPVPEIYAWSSEASSNSVGAEYIIMEKASGVELTRVWPKLLGNERGKIVRQIVQFQKSFTASSFPGIGSLYYAESLDNGVSSIPVKRGPLETTSRSKKFVIGPINDQRFFEEGRGDIDCDRGPCTFTALGHISTSLTYVSGACTADYLVALGLHDLSYVKSGHKPPSPGIFGGPSWYEPSVAKKIAALEGYVKIARYLPPSKDPSVTAPVLWHDDLHSGNIFVHPDDPTQITCIIDWQSTCILPLIRHVTRPEFLDFEGPKPLTGFIGDARKAPDLPANFKHMSQEEQKEAEALVRQQSLYKFFEILSAKENRSVSAALLHQETPRCQLIDFAAMTGYDAEPQVKARLIGAVDAWAQIVGPDGPPCPLHYSEDERKTQAEDLTNWTDCCALLDSVMESLGVPNGWDGAVSSEDYDKTRERLRVVREDFLDLMAKDDEERARWAKAWPYDDDEDVNK